MRPAHQDHTAGAIAFIVPIGGKVSSYFNNLNSALP
jgi:hypothetical protein